jgi:DNA replication protein DnaC
MKVRGRSSGPTPEWAAGGVMLLETFEDRHDKGSLVSTSQVPVDRWHDLIGVPTLADAIRDRVVHNGYRIELAGESLRKRRSQS